MRLVFVSSTFKDMQFERDALKVRVAPRIDSFLLMIKAMAMMTRMK